MGWFDKKDKDPSDSDANSEFDGDSFDSQLDDLSLDGDDFSFDPDVDDTESRSPVYKKLKNIGVDLDHIKSNALEGTTDGISKAIDDAAPKVGEAWQGGKDLISEIDSLGSDQRTVLKDAASIEKLVKTSSISGLLLKQGSSKSQLQYKNSSAVTGEFHLYVPVKMTYVFGKTPQTLYSVVTVTKSEGQQTAKKH